MPHTREKRGFGGVLFDTLKPKIESMINEHGGHAVYAVPLVGDALKAAVRSLGGARTANTVLFAAGLTHIARHRFPSGESGDTAHYVANEFIDELAQAVARHSKEITEDELNELSRFADWITSQTRRILRRGDGKGEEEMPEKVPVQVIGEGDEQVKRFHHPDCPEIDAEIAVDEGQGARKRTVRKHNPKYQQIYLTSAKKLKAALKLEQCETCAALFETDTQKQAPAKKPAKKSALGHIAELTPEEQTALWARIDAALELVPEGERAAKRKEIEGKLRMIDSVEELRAILTMPLKSILGDGLDLARDQIREELEQMGKNVKTALASSRNELHMAADVAAASLHNWNARSADRRAALKARWKRGY